MEADRFGESYKHLLVEGLTRSLVAARAEIASMKTGTNVTLQLLFCMWNPAINTDSVLNGPTNEVWLFPWLNYLNSKGVRYYHGHKGNEIIYESGQVKGVIVTGPDGITKTITGDV